MTNSRLRWLVCLVASAVPVVSCNDVTGPEPVKSGVSVAAPKMTLVTTATPQVAAGGIHTCAVKSDATIVCWGRNFEGQTTIPSGLTGVTAIATGYYHTCAVESGGNVVCWGSNNSGQTSVPAGLAGVTGISAGVYHTCALLSNGTVVCWGLSGQGQTTIPAGLTGVTGIATGYYHTCALKSNGSVVCWGGNSNGETTIPSGLTGVTAIATGAHHACALRSDATVACWGNNDYGQTTIPSGLTGVTAVAAGFLHTCAVRFDASVICWGYNSKGQATVPSGVSEVGMISLGAEHTCALKSNGTVVCWGYNVFGQATVPTGLNLLVNEFAAQTITFTSTAPSPALVNGTYGVAATGGASGNAVTFSSLSTSICTVSGSTVSLIGVGSCIVAADQAGNDDYSAASQVTQIFTVGAASQAITFTSTAPVGALEGGTYAANATGGASGNAVTLTSTTTPICTVSSNMVTFVSAGTCTIAANQAAGSGYTAAPQVTQSFGIGSAAQSINFTSVVPNPGMLGDTYSVSATGGASGNPVIFSSPHSLVTPACSVSSSTVSFIGVGTCTVTANQAAGSGYSAAPEVTQTITVKSTQTISFTSTAPSPANVGGMYNVSGTGGASGSSVIFSSTTPSVCTVSGSVASLIAGGTCTVAANQAAGTYYLAAPQVTQTFSVLASQAITFTSTAPSPGTFGGSYNVAATGGGSGNTVTFSSLSPTICSVSSNTVSFIGVGSCTVAANQTGSGFLSAAPQVTQMFSIVAIAQSISFTSATPIGALEGGSYSATATGGASGNPVTFTSNTPTVCTVSGNTASLLSVGTCTVAANQAAATGYSAATEETQSFSVASAAQAINFTSSVPTPGMAGSTYTVSATGGASGNAVAFSSLTPSVCSVTGNTVGFITVGTCTVAANQSAGAGYTAAPQVTQNIGVNATQAITFTSSVPVPAAFGGSYNVAATGGGSGNAVSFSSTTTSVCAISGSTVSLISTGTCTLAANQAAGGGYFAAPEVTQTFTVVAANTSTTVFLSQSSQQYSDKVTLTATVTPASLGGSSPSGSVQFKLDGVSIGAPQPLASGSASLVDYPIGAAAGSHSVSAVFTSTESNFTGSTSTGVTLIVTKEDATVTAGAGNLTAVQVSSAGGTASSISLSFQVSERALDLAAATAAAGNIANAGFSASLIPVGPGGSINLSCGTGTVAGSGYPAVKTFTCTASNIPVNTYEVATSVAGNYYAGTYSDAITVFDPSLGFATGGGSFSWPGTGLKTTFGFTMKYNKNGSNVQGNALILRHEADGTVTRMKSNSLNGLALGENAAIPMGYATFSGKSTYTAPGMVDGIGNQNFTIYVEDRNGPGTGIDRIWVGGPQSLAMTGPAATNTTPLVGGNISVAHRAK